MTLDLCINTNMDCLAAVNFSEPQGETQINNRSWVRTNQRVPWLLLSLNRV
jgi:hypothetical protein